MLPITGLFAKAAILLLILKRVSAAEDEEISDLLTGIKEAAIRAAGDGGEQPAEPDYGENDLDPLPGEDQVDQWESIPLMPPSNDELMRDSEAILRAHLSEARQEIEEELQAAFNQMSLSTADNGKVEGWEKLEKMAIDADIDNQSKSESTKMTIIFNTSDFDEDFDDVDGDSPMVPANIFNKI